MISSINRPRRGITRRADLLLCILAVPMVGLLSGCGLTAAQKDAVAKFGESAAKLGTATGTQLSVAREIEVKMNLERILLQGYIDPGDMSRSGLDPTKLDQSLPSEAAEIIMSAANGLAAYGKTLVALVTDTQTPELKAAASTLSINLASIPGAQLTASQQGAITSAVTGISGFLIEEKRKQAVLAVVLNAQRSVDTLCDRLIVDFDPSPPFGSQRGVIAQGLEKSGEPLYGFAIATWKSGKSYHERSAAQNGIKLAFDARIIRNNDLLKTQNAARSMKRANASLVTAVQGSQWSLEDLIEFAEKAQSLQSAVQSSLHGGNP